MADAREVTITGDATRFNEFFEHLSKESTRGQVLIAGGLLEEQLGILLKAFFREGKSADRLIGKDNELRPLSAFSTRIDACHALGLINDNEYNDLHIIREIRNRFAHQLEASFEDQSVIDRCHNLRRWSQVVKKDGRPVTSNAPQTKYLVSASNVLLALMNRAFQMDPHRRTEIQWDY